MFNKTITETKREGSISVILIVMLFGSILLAVNMETVQTAKNIERVELADVITNIPIEPGEPAYVHGEPAYVHDFGRAVFYFEGMYWQYDDGTRVTATVDNTWVNGQLVPRRLLTVFGDGYSANQVCLSNGEIDWQFIVYDPSKFSGMYVLTPTLEGYHIYEAAFMNYDFTDGSTQSCTRQWDPVNNTVTYSGIISCGYDNKMVNWIENTETGDVTAFMILDSYNAEGVQISSRVETIMKNTAGEYEYTVINMGPEYESNTVTYPVGTFPPDITNPFGSVSIGNERFPTIPPIPSDVLELKWELDVHFYH